MATCSFLTWATPSASSIWLAISFGLRAEIQIRNRSVAKVMRAAAQPPPTHVRDDVRELLALATGGREHDLRAALMEYALAPSHPQTVDARTVDSGDTIEVLSTQTGDHAQPVATGR